VVSNGVDTAHFSPTNDEPEQGFLLFTGTMSYRPNGEAVRHFVKQILPLILRERADAQFHVVGDAPSKEVKALAGRHVFVHGFVPDMRIYHRQAAVVVVPLLRGGGTKLKVLEAAAMGKAIVTTSHGVDGLPFRNGEEVLVADAPTDFARAVVSAADDPALRQKLGENARRRSLQFAWQTIEDRFLQTANSLAQHRTAQGPFAIVSEDPRDEEVTC